MKTLCTMRSLEALAVSYKKDEKNGGEGEKGVRPSVDLGS